MIAGGIELERTNRPIECRADVEVDWDIETRRPSTCGDCGSAPGRTSRARHPFVIHRPAAAEELELARQAMGWLVGLLDAHPDAHVFHYSDYEMIHLSKLASASADPVLNRALELLRDRHVDLFETMRGNYFGAHGLSLKIAARAAAGFQWRDDTPGGLNSQSWFDEATHGPDEQTRAEARQRVLDYNEDDVRATLALRDWLRTAD